MSIPSWAMRGAKVAAIRNVGERGGGAKLTRGQVYIIRDIFISPVDGGVGVRLVGISMRLHILGHETGWRIEHFQPVIETKSDDEIEARLYHNKGLHQSAPRRKSVEA